MYILDEILGLSSVYGKMSIILVAHHPRTTVIVGIKRILGHILHVCRMFSYYRMT